ncbi:MAG: hypothetical protein IJ304_00365 [Clostridia bacterium]|nr:hypothetical protein [Clostridia bacterium]
MRYTIKHLSILLLICIAALSMPFFAAASSLPQIEGNAISSQVGDRVNVIFNISNAENICGGNFNVVYSSEYLQIVSAKAGDVFKSLSPVINTKYDTGKVRVTWAGITPIEQSGTLIALEFLVKDGAPSGELSVNIEGLKLYDFDAKTIEAQLSNAKVNVKNTYLVMIPENNGEQVSVSVNLEGDNSCMGGSLVLAYDNSALSPVSVGKGALLAGATVTNNLSYTSNTVKVSWAGTEAVSEKGEFFKLVFDVVDGFSGTVKFAINNTTLYDENSKSLAVQTEEITLDIAEIIAKTPFITISTVKSQSEGVLPISIDENSMICGGGIEIEYDNTAVEILNVSLGEALAGRTTTLNDKYEENVIKVTWAGALPMAVSGDILNISFRVIDTSKNFAVFSIRNLDLYNSNMQPVKGDYENGGVAISCIDEDCLTSTSYRKDKGLVIFESYVLDNPDNSTLFVALYKDQQMVKYSVQDAPKSGFVTISMDDCEFDSGKVMLWNNESLSPQSKAEVINK